MNESVFWVVDTINNKVYEETRTWDDTHKTWWSQQKNSVKVGGTVGYNLFHTEAEACAVLLRILHEERDKINSKLSQIQKQYTKCKNPTNT